MIVLMIVCIFYVAGYLGKIKMTLILQIYTKPLWQ